MTMEFLRKPAPAATPSALRVVPGGQNADARLNIDANGARDKAAFMRCLARDLGFPPYFGGNWDAVEECLTDLDWHAGETTLIKVTHAAPLNEADPSVLTTFQHIVRDLAARTGAAVQLAVTA